MGQCVKWIIVDHTKTGNASGTAMKMLLSALDGANIPYERKVTWTGPLPENIIIAAVNSDRLVRALVKETVYQPQSVQLNTLGELSGNARIISGSDDLGLAYALAEMAERIESYGETALINILDEKISPATRVRGIDKIVCNTNDMDWWMDEDYWREYLKSMLCGRFNRLVLLVGFDTPYLSPAYPFFVEVPEYPDVRLINSKIDRKAHLEALRRLGRQAHEYGMEFVFATWQQSLWLPRQTAMVEGIKDLTAYCAAGIRELILACPEIDMIQLRVNHEAGVGTQVTAEEYWYRQLDGLAEAVKRGADIKLDLRAKGLTDSMISYAKELGLDLTVSTKYWCEYAGLPYHLTRMRTEELERLDNFNHSRRYSYSDMLKKPRFHKFLYRLWNDGSTNIFTWGDPDYVRRFTASMALGDAEGFEIMPLLSLKGGSEDYKYVGWPLFDDPDYQPDGRDESRYWLSNRLFGRIGYNPNEDPEAWMRPMRKRFGKAAGPLMSALSAASKLIPFIIAFHTPVHPQLDYWPEFSTGGAIFAENNHNSFIKNANVTYQSTEPGDAGLFYPIGQYAADFLAGAKEDRRYTPWQVASWLINISSNVMKNLREAENNGIPDSPEARGLVLDLRMLNDLALYHRYKIGAALAFCLKKYKEALSFMELARDKWLSFAELGQKYHKRLAFFVGYGGASRSGNWMDFVPELNADIEKLRSMLGAMLEEKETDPGESFPYANIQPPAWTDNVPVLCKAGHTLPVSLKTGANDVFRGDINLRYRHANQMEGKFLSATMKYENGLWHGEIPAEYITPEWDILIYFDAAANNGDGIIFPGLWNPVYDLPYHIVEVI